MTDNEVNLAFLNSKRVFVNGHDYNFNGKIVAVFLKRDKKSIRVVVENDDRVCLIQSPKNLAAVICPIT